jgi:hypothetical protein
MRRKLEGKLKFMRKEVPTAERLRAAGSGLCKGGIFYSRVCSI